MPVDIGHGLHEHRSQPNERGRRGVVVVVANALRRGQVGFLEHVIGIDATEQPSVHSEIDHPPETLPMLGKERRQCLDVAGLQPQPEWIGLSR